MHQKYLDEIWQNYFISKTIVEEEKLWENGEVNMLGRAGITNLHSPTKRVMKRHPTKGALWVGIFTVTKHEKPKFN